MSYTQTDNIYFAVNERGINRAFAAVFNTRPQLFNYTSVKPSPGAGRVTIVDPIKIPLSSAVLQWTLAVELPQLDLYPENAPPAPPAPSLSFNQFALSTTFDLEIFDPGSTSSGSGGTLPVRAVGKLINAGSADAPVLAFQAVSVDVADVAPAPLHAVVDQLAEALLQAILGAVRIPITALALDTLTLRLTSPPPHPELPALPVADMDSIEAWGLVK